MKSLCSISTASLIRSSPFLSLSRTSSNRFALKIPASLYLSHPTSCCFSNPSSSQESLDSSHGGMSRPSISVFAGHSLNNLKMQVGSPISLHSMNPLAKLSLSDQAFLLLAFITCTTSVAFTSLVIAAIPTLVAMGRAATSFAKLADTARKELPSTLAAVRLSGMEISDLTLELSDLSQDIADGVNKSAKAVQAAEAGIKQIGTLAQQQTLSMIEERANLPEISLQPVVAGAAEKTSQAIGSATKRLMNIISGGGKDEDSLDV
ncbi:hypothetical protein CARUB_v10010041mg [Capsella rubella]|uniref:Uncharacterized protein n=1 Tax=Capsella rubella TaxID=81985 RepID=R0GK93_9BRAS|nr:uncharacterized protein LOC17897575 [Capsella rubella]EOA36176.1 hypothetical protein CARUB_v10010041mg [Capsella rubella]